MKLFLMKLKESAVDHLSSSSFMVQNENVRELVVK
jgi:hypothetical protein